MTVDDMDRMWAFAERVAPAKFVPEHLRGDPNSIFFALAIAQDLGITWTRAMLSTFPSSEGSLGVKGDILLALLLKNKFIVDFAFTDKPLGCTCTITRPDGSEPVSRTFTMDDAQLIETRWNPEQDRWERLAENYFYRNFPKASTQWRSLAMCGRVAAADIMGGLYSLDELQEGAGSKPAIGAAPSVPPADEFVVGEKPEPPAEPPTPAPADLAPPDPAPPTPPPTPVMDPEPSKKSTGWTSPPPAEPEPSVAPSAPAPPAPAPAPPAPAPQPLPGWDTMITYVRSKLGGETKDSDRLIARYFAGFLGVKPDGGKLRLPKDRTVLLPPLEKLWSIIDARVGDLKALPEQLGAELGGRAKSKLDAEFDLLNWPAPIRELARRVMSMMNMDEPTFLEWIGMPIASHPDQGADTTIASLQPESLAILFPLYLLVRERALEPVDLAVANQRGITATLQEMVTASNMPIETWDQPFAVAVLDKIREITRADSVKPPAPAPSKKDEQNDFMNGGLPFED